MNLLFEQQRGKTKMKEYTISFKNNDEFHSESIREIKEVCKEHKEKEIEQVFYKTYKYNKSEKEYTEKDCVLLYCDYQKINTGIKFKEV